MNRDDRYQAYLNLANALFDRQISENDLLRAALELPLCDKEFLDRLADQAETTALQEPRLGWAITEVAYQVVLTQESDLFLQSLAAWYVSRAANYWGQPERVATASLKARRGFTRLGDKGWIAACDWQLNALPWTKPSFLQAARKLKDAIGSLEHFGFDAFVPQCRLALSYAQLLIGDYAEAEKNIRASEETFAATDDQLNIARCWYNVASLLRLQGRMNGALETLDKTLASFESENAIIDTAKVHYQLALCHLIMVDDLSLASKEFKKAIEIFKMHDMDLWQAMCTTNLGYVYLLKGSLSTAAQHFQLASECFVYHRVNGMLGDNLNDSGKLNVMLGHPEISIEQFREAQRLHSGLGPKLTPAIDAANLGEAYGYLGRYQDALHFLESAADQLYSLGNFMRLGACEIFTALIWARLGQPAVALNHLDKATFYHKQSNPKGLLSSIYFHRAVILFSQKEYVKAIDYLETSLQAASTHNVRPQVALAQRLLGEALLSTERNAEALDYLTQAKSDFAEMGMTMEQAAALVAIGFYYLKTSAPDLARGAFTEALSLSEDVFPEIAWKAYSGLAEIAEVENEHQAEIQFYRNAMSALAKVRHNFWQPELAGSYLQGPSTFFDKAIVRLVETGHPQDALQFIEQNKATTLLLQLSTSSIVSDSKESQELTHLRSEINWLKDQLRVSFDSSSHLKSIVQSRQMRAQLTQKVRLYDEMSARVERQSILERTNRFPLGDFDLAAFRKLATSSLGESWVCLDYYLADRRLITALVTPRDFQVLDSPLSERMVMALRASARAKQNILPLESDLRTLGDVLIPASLADILTPDTFLLLAPHEKLHGIPWAAIQPNFMDQPLVCNCIPVVVPSLQTLALLWERAVSSQPHQESGVVIGLSGFHGLERELPFVKAEVTALGSRLGSDGKLLAEQDATWQNLMQLSKEQETANQRAGLSRFDWLHIASHFFVDTETGRLSGIVLGDGDVWLDKLRDLAPLPNLVTFSACNSIYSYVYEGDEHVGIPTTCLIAGANTIVGSAWPIFDESAAEFATLFYKHYFEGLGPARAVAQTQREMIKQRKTVGNWASFTCIGAP